MRPTLEELKKQICEKYGATIAQIEGEILTDEIVSVRHEYMCKAWKDWGYSYNQIGRSLNRHRTTVMYAIKKAGLDIVKPVASRRPLHCELLELAKTLTPQQIADKYSVDISTSCKWLRGAGLELAPTPKKRGEDLDKKIVDAIRSGVTVSKIMRDTGETEYHVRKLAKQHSLTPAQGSFIREDKYKELLATLEIRALVEKDPNDRNNWPDYSSENINPEVYGRFVNKTDRSSYGSSAALCVEG